MGQQPFVGLGFCATFRNADPSVIGPLGVVKGLAPQIAWGASPAVDSALLPAWIATCYQHGLVVRGWAWCAATNTLEAKAEARYHVERCADLGLAWFIANPEEPYDAHGNQSDPRYHMVTAYVEAFHQRADELGLDFPALGLTSTPTFGSDMTAPIGRGWTGMPQAFSLAAPAATVANCVAHWNAWGWPNSQLRPLVQTYRTDGNVADPQPYLAESAAAGVGVVPYTVEQAMDTEGQMLLTALKPATMRGPSEEEPVEKIGYQDGVTASMNRLREQDAAGTIVQKTGGKWPKDPLATIAAVPLDQWKAYDKLERALSILIADHDASP
jgi:hypothetical protein